MTGSNPSPSQAPRNIELHGARIHNLKRISVEIPHGQFVVCTGVSGSGKSSLAFDTLFAEGQRRCLEILAPAARARLDLLPRPPLDSLTGLPPVVAVAQRYSTGQPRSTLATLTELSPFLRLLYARAGVAHCPRCDREVTTQTPEQIVETILALETGRKVMLLSPWVRARKGAQREVFEQIVKQGFVRARVDGELVDASAPPELAKSRAHTIEVVVDRIIIKEGLRARLVDSVALALKHGQGACIVSEQESAGWRDRLLSSRHACPDCQISLPELEPRTLNFNSPHGACPDCTGLGVVNETPCPACEGERLAPAGRRVRFAGLTLPAFCRSTVRDARTQVVEWERLHSPVVQRVVPEIARRLQFLDDVGLDYLTLDRPLETLSGGELQRARLAGALSAGLVGSCYILDEPTMGLHPRDTQRLLEALLTLRDRGNTLLVVEHDPQVMQQADWLIDIGPGAGREGGHIVAAGPLARVRQSAGSQTARFLLETSSPPAPPLQTPDPSRIMQVSHANRRNLRNLQVSLPLGMLVGITGVSGSGKSTLMLETVAPLLREGLRRRDQQRRFPSAKRPTPGRKGRRQSPPPEPDATAAESGEIVIDGVGCLAGWQTVERLLEVDQVPLSRSPRANPATLSGLWTELRRLFARTRESRRLGFGPARYSLQSAEGRCTACRGTGIRRLAIELLPDAQTPCPVCQGTRFHPSLLAVRFLDHNPAGWLDLRFDEVLPLVANLSRLQTIAQTFVDVGLGYLGLGQSLQTLSGGEAQRVKLACELARGHSAHTLYLLDEPTTGLHPADVERLLQVLRRLVEAGHSVLVIEHHTQLLRQCDWLLDLGPEGGAGGGELVAAGSPHDLARAKQGWTARALCGEF